MKLVAVDHRQVLRDWHDVPRRIYKGDANWIPHLKQDVEKVFDSGKNKLLEAGAARRWVLYDAEGRAAGRVAAFINPLTARAGEYPVAGMGFFECIDDAAAARLLLDAVRDWLEDQGMEAMDGPVNLGPRNMFWGLLIENFTDAPVYGANYNPPNYRRLLEDYGFRIYYKQLFFKRSLAVPAQPVFYAKLDRLAAEPGFEVRNAVGMSLEKIAADFRSVYNDAWAVHDDFRPMMPEAALKITRAMAPVMDRRIMLFAYHRDRPVGFFINLPELNGIFKHLDGNLDLIGKLKFLWHKRRRAVRTMTGIAFGVVSEFQGKGVEAAMVVHTEKHIAAPGFYRDLVLTWIGDFNPRMLRVCENLGAMNYRTSATYRYLFDRNRPFERHPIMGGRAKTSSMSPE
jgi:GNAT superfamily N-acetyltransferase